MNIKNQTKKRLEQYPKLQKCVKRYIETQGEFELDKNNKFLLPKLVYYIRCMDIYPPEFFKWDKETTEDFESWGHNSRYAHTFMEMLEENLDEYINIIIDKLDNNQENKKEIFYKEERYND